MGRSRFSMTMRTFPERRLVVLLTCCLAAALSACGRTDKSEAGARHYEARGIVRAVAPDHSTLDIEHETIPGFMPSMTMPFTVKNPPESAALRPGDAISFRLAVTDKDAWIDQIKPINAADVHLTAKTEPAPKVEAAPRLRAGDAMPPFELADQNGLPITLDTFRGRPFVLTFIFTRCPIPNFCPLMSKNFAQLQSAIKSGAGALARTRLLSISFDPDYDTPQVLRDYAASEKADPARWSFATGTPARIKELTSGFSVLVQPEAGTISHSLATALIDANGRIVEIWRGNGWKPEEVVAKIAALESPPQ
jgi:protein SCO1